MQTVLQDCRLKSTPANETSKMREANSYRFPGPYYPLQGLRVLEFCWVWAGPFLGQFLADLGAEVIKVEWYDRFDVYRTRGIERMRGKVPDHIYREMSPSFHSLNRNKVGFSVNLKEPEGVDLIKQLAGKSDLVIENWSSGTLDRLGIGYDALKAANPTLVMLSLSAFGPSSRLAAMRSYGLVTSALGGAEEPLKVDGEFVGSPTFNVSDPNAALFGLLGAMAALIEAHESGKGSNLVVSQLEAVMTLMSDQMDSKRGDGMVHGVFETADKQYVAVSMPAHGDKADLAQWCRTLDAEQLMADVQSMGGQGATVINVIDSADAAIFADLEVRSATEHPITGREDVIAAPWRINGRRAPIRKPAPLMSEGNTYVLRDILGLPDAAIQSLKERRIV